jgi:hypothetical protein
MLIAVFVGQKGWYVLIDKAKKSGKTGRTVNTKKYNIMNANPANVILTI